MSSSSAPAPSKTATATANIPPPTSPTSLDTTTPRHPNNVNGKRGAPSKPLSAPRSSQSSKQKHKHRNPSRKNSTTPAQTSTTRSNSNSHSRLDLSDALLDDDDDPSLFTRSLTSRKGQMSITHLLDFSRPSPYDDHHSHSHSHSPYLPPRRPRRTFHGPLDKARYVHANYRFIVRPDRVYAAHTRNADVHLDWRTDVLQVLASARYQGARCPICLCEPVAPRMARCGHVFCLGCLIRYMHAEEEEKKAGTQGGQGAGQGTGTGTVPERKKWKKCPICEDSIYLSEARSVRYYGDGEDESVVPREGQEIALRLMMRRAGHTLALPRETVEGLQPVVSGVEEEDVPWYEPGSEVCAYARIMKGGEGYMRGQYEREMGALKRQAVEDDVLFGDDTRWIKMAMASVREAGERVRGMGEAPKRSAEGEDALEAGMREMDITTDTATETTPDATTTAPAKQKQKRPTNPPADAYYFYQALPHFYLSPLDIRILRASFGPYALFPPTLHARIDRISTGHTVDDNLRKRTKYLSHLPHGCEVNFLECDWRGVVADEVLVGFKSEIERRRRRYREKTEAEERERERAERVEARRWRSEFVAARRAGAGVDEDGEVGFLRRPRFSEFDFPVAGAGAGVEEGGSSGEHADETNAEDEGSAAAAAAAQKTVWGTVAPAADPALGPPLPRDDGWLKDWEQELMLQERMLGGSRGEAEDGGEGRGESSAAGGAGGAEGKKKKGKGKGKKITLMSTAVRRGA